MRRAWFAFILVLAVFAALHPASAAFQGSFVTIGGSYGAESSGASFSLSGSNGYAISVEGSGAEVTLSASAIGGVASYRVRGRTSKRRIVARFGNRGRIDVRFRQTEGFRRRMPPPRCKGKPRITRFGVFAGTIRFRGEHGYTQVDARGARGVSYSRPPWKCKRREHGKFTGTGREPEAGKTTELQAQARSGRLSFDASAYRVSEWNQTTFLADLHESRGGMRIDRIAIALGREGSFEFDESGLNTATVQPPSPFDGTATFFRGTDDSPTWTGSLRVSLPGAPNVRLAGSRFQARLTQSPFGQRPRVAR